MPRQAQPGQAQPKRAATTRALTGLLAAAALLLLPACSPAAPQGTEAKTLKVAYQKTDSFTALDDVLTAAKAEFEAANSGVTVELQPIQANDDDYGTKLALSTVPPERRPTYSTRTPSRSAPTSTPDTC